MKDCKMKLPLTSQTRRYDVKGTRMDRQTKCIFDADGDLIANFVRVEAMEDRSFSSSVWARMGFHAERNAETVARIVNASQDARDYLASRLLKIRTKLSSPSLKVSERMELEREEKIVEALMKGLVIE